MKNKKIYYMINFIFMCATLYILLFANKYNKIVVTPKNVVLLVIIFLLIHVFKCFRQYLLLIEEGIHINEFIILYIRSTFCSMILPYKIGELYKAYLYGYKINNYIKGFIAVIIDKFFDALFLLIICISFEVNNNLNLSAITWILLTFVILFVIIYFSFKQTYYYLNKHFMLHSNSKRTNFVLSWLERFYDIYKSVCHMIKGRELLLILFTILAWTFELILLKLLNISNFVDYFNIVFFEMSKTILQNYIIISLIGFGLIEMINIAVKTWRLK